ncbi:MAG: response regulator transcription factor [Dehalococcoidia bacterium]|jgi:DNA-binding NarL/FixJ family response regulator
MTQRNPRAERPLSFEGRGQPGRSFRDDAPPRQTANSGRQVRVLVADPTDLARQGLRGLLAVREDLDVVASCRTIDDAVSECAKQSPDVALIGYGFSEPQRLEAVRQIVRSRASMPVLVVTDHPDLDVFLACVKAGARGYLGADVHAWGLIDAVLTLAFGGCAVEPVILRDLFAYLAGVASSMTRGIASGRDSALAKLSPREREVLRLMAQGKGNKEIASLLGISAGTTKTHLRHIFKKLRVSDRTGAVLTALEIDPAKLLPAA